MKKCFFGLFSATLLCAAAVPGFAAYKSEYKLDIVPSIDTAWGNGAQRFAELVKERTDGRVNIKVFPNAQLTTGKQTNAFMLLRNGTIDFAIQSSINWSPQIVELNLFALPFFVSKYEDRYAAMDAITSGKSGEMIKAAVEAKGAKVLGFGENGFRELTNSKREIRTPGDFNGLKIRVVGSPLFLDTYKAVGANPVNMNWADTMSAVQQGVIDGQENPISTFWPVKMYEYQKYILDWHCVIDPTLFAVNPSIWKTFSEEDQKIIEQAAKDAADYQIALARVGFDGTKSADYLKSIGEEKEIVDWYAVMQDKGMVITTLTADELATFVKTSEPVLQQWRKKIGAKLVDLADEEMKAAQK